MKRGIAALMSAFLALQSPLGMFHSLAALSGDRNGAADSKQETTATPSDAGQRPVGTDTVSTGKTSAVSERRKGTGKIKIELQGVIPSKASSWNIVLRPTGEDGGQELDTEYIVTIPAMEEDGLYTKGTLILDDIANGTYDLQLLPTEESETSYLPYEHKNIRVGSDITTLRLVNDNPEVHGYTEKVGALSMGDITGDGILNEEDKKELLELAAKDSAAENASGRADLNGDGRVDLLDVSYFARFYKAGLADRKAQAVKSLLVDDIEVATASDAVQILDGTIEDVFSGTGSVQIGTQETIGEGNPVSLSATFENPKTMAGFVISPVIGSGNSIQNAEITVEDGAGNKTTISVINGKQQAISSRAGTPRKMARADGTDDEMTQGIPIVIDLGGQIPVKKVTIKVNKTLCDTKLVDISSVEFLNNMEDHIPEPEMSIPDRIEVANSDASFTVIWRKQPNVTGYEVKVTGTNSKDEEVTETKLVENGTSLEVAGIGTSKLVNGNTYEIEIRSVNGDWRSPAVFAEAKPRATKIPPAPENLVITPGYMKLTISWKDMKDTETYNLYYRVAGDTNAPYASVKGIEGTSYVLRDLLDVTKYEIYMTGTNIKGEGPASIHYTAETASLDPPVTPNYKLINTLVPDSNRTAQIESVQYGGEGEHEFDIADGDYATSWIRLDWDAGCAYPGENKSPIVTFDAAYQMDTIALIPDEEQNYSYVAATVYYWDEAGQKNSLRGVLNRKTSNNKAYYMVETQEPFTAKRVQIAMSTYSGRRISVAEYKFYYYDPLEDDIMALYADDYHVSLKADVTQGQIDALRARLDVKDEVSGELHPKKEILETELSNAERILKDGSLQAEILKVDSKDTAKSDSHINFSGGLNTYQPLGVTAMAGDTLVIYAGGANRMTGDATNLELIEAQYHGSSAAVFKSLGALKIGANEITIQAIDQMDLERGGQLYVVYKGNKGAEEYGVRVSGGTKIPVLDLSDTTDASERMEKALVYVDALEKMNGEAEALHMANHTEHAWDAQNCIYEATDLVGRYVMFSLATPQVLGGLGNGSREEKAKKLCDTMQAMDDMIYLFYQHKGLSEDPEAAAYNKMPVGRQNIRYQRMFAGAFMYAGGRHIGIEWGSIPGMMAGVPVEAEENGKYISGSYFGWGIAHEIGHEINEGAYAVAEITNNYFAQLAKSRDTNDTTRFNYDSVFKKVTSGTKGKSSNGAVQLALYWQLHQAYDLGGYNFKTYDKSSDQLANLFFARVDSYARNQSAAPGAEGNKLTLQGADTDNKLMRLSVAAAEKDILEFFRHWGMEPDAGTIKYAEQFAKETRGIWFANDEMRVYQMENTPEQNQASEVTVSGSLSYTDGANEVTLSLSGSPDIWVYEIYRYERIKNEIVRRPVGYVRTETGDAEFTDVIGTINNHTFTYEAVGYDRWLNPTEKKEIGSVKVCHDGRLDPSLWTIETNLTNEEADEPDDENPEQVVQPGLEVMIDNDAQTSFTGLTEDGAVPEIILHLNQAETVTGLVYKATEGTPIGSFKIYVSEDGGTWKQAEVRESQFALDANGQQTIHFTDGKNLYTYDASYVKIVAEGQGGKRLTISEISLLGQTGDDVVLTAEGGIGILKNAYIDNGQTLIPAGSLVFTGTYKGNPAYNTVLLWDENGTIVGGLDAEDNLNAGQYIFAPDPQDGMLGEVSDGIWVYYIEPEYVSSMNLKKVRAELYRVDNAETQEGERMVSSTMFVDVPSALPDIELNAGTAAAVDRSSALKTTIQNREAGEND